MANALRPELSRLSLRPSFLLKLFLNSQANPGLLCVLPRPCYNRGLPG
jgi:hypothetical protein